MKKKLYWIGLVIFVIVFFIFIKFPFFNEKPEFQTTIFEKKNGTVGESIDVPAKKYPNGFPIEILDCKDHVIDGKRYFTGYCRWHPEADSSVGGKVAVVPVVLYRLHFDVKKLEEVGQTITRRTDGYYKLIAPTIEDKYSVGVRIEKALNCPEKFKKHKPKERMKQRERAVM